MADVTSLAPLTLPVSFPQAVCAGHYVNQADFLRLSARSAVASVVVEFTGIFLQASGWPVPIQFTIAPGSDRSETSGVLHLGEGYLLHLSARIQSGTVRRGQCYVKAQLQRGDIANALIHTLLISDYASLDFEPAFARSLPCSPLAGPGILRSIAGADPAAGAEIIVTVPTNARWKLHALRATLVTDATVATRTVNFQVDDGTTILLNFPGATTQTASLTRAYNFAQYAYQPSAVGTDIFFALPFGMNLLQAWRLVTSTTNLQAGDNWGAPQLLVEEWIEE